MKITKEFLSGYSQDGRGMKIAATSSPGDTVHVAVSGTTDKDEVWLYLYNAHTAAVVATVQLGGTATPDDDIKMTIPFQQGRYLMLDGQPLNNAKAVKVYAATTNVIIVTGHVNRISP